MLHTWLASLIRSILHVSTPALQAHAGFPVCVSVLACVPRVCGRVSDAPAAEAPQHKYYKGKSISRWQVHSMLASSLFVGLDYNTDAGQMQHGGPQQL